MLSVPHRLGDGPTMCL